MQQIDIEKFLFLFQQQDFGSFQPDHLDGLRQLLGFIEADNQVADLRWAAYMLATAMHETGRTFLPVREIGKGQGRDYGRVDAVTGEVYYGRGYVQLTWADNYKTMGNKVGINLYREPDRALEPAVAYQIMSEGMRRGMFTGVGLGRFLNGNGTDWVNARKIINGRDCAEKIAGYAVKIYEALQQCSQESTIDAEPADSARSVRG